MAVYFNENVRFMPKILMELSISFIALNLANIKFPANLSFKFKK